MMSALPNPPHCQRFLWWHAHFCGPCKDYGCEVIEALQKYVGETMRIPQFVGLSDASIDDVDTFEWYEGADS